MKIIKFITILCLLFLIVLVSNCSKNTPSLTRSESLQVVLNKNLEAFKGTGVSAAVVDQSRDLWVGTCGVSFGTNSITEDMIFGIGSVTKTFIAALCLQLADEGVFNLDDSLHSWLPDFHNIDNSITIRQLLYNTSGVYNISDNSDLWSSVFNDPARFWTPEKIITSFLREPYSSPGEVWYYSNTNYILLGMIINEATGSLVSTELRNRIFEPLGLNNTFFAIEEALPSNIAHGWFNLSGDDNYEDISLLPKTGIYSVLWTSAAIFSTAADLANWSTTLFQGNVLSQSALNQMLTPCNIVPGTTDVGCGMGIFLLGPGNSTGVELIGYTGRTFGYLTSMFYLPDYGISVVVIINEDNTPCLDAITTDLILKALEYAN